MSDEPIVGDWIGEGPPPWERGAAISGIMPAPNPIAYMLVGYIGSQCIVCRHVYDSVQDLEVRNPVRATANETLELACSACYEVKKLGFTVEELAPP